MTMTYEEAVRWLKELPPFVPRKLEPGEDPFSLDALRELLKRLGDPQERLHFIHVTGTNGKGSTCAYLTQILTNAGFRTGFYTSPAIERINERIRIGAEQIPDEAFARIVERVRDVCLDMRAEGAPFPSEFEQVTAASFLYFLENACDPVVLEVGLGGRVDATNVIPAPLLAVFTPIGMDHMESLGDTPGKIAREKSGIIKHGSAVLTCPQEEEVRKVLKGKAKEEGAAYFEAYMPEVSRFSVDGQTFYMSLENGEPLPFFTSMCGACQVRNAALAVQAAVLLRKDGYEISDTALRRGIAQTVWPGRFEILERRPYLIADGSHNPHGVRALTESLERLFPGRRITFVTGVMADKSYEEMMRQIVPLAGRIYTVTPPSVRALPAEDLAACLRRLGAVAEACPDVSEALCRAKAKAKADDVICAFGSLSFIGEVRSCRTGR